MQNNKPSPHQYFGIVAAVWVVCRVTEITQIFAFKLADFPLVRGKEVGLKWPIVCEK